jgi:dTDP-4-dehydrorhamnose 3,5-epimerase
MIFAETRVRGAFVIELERRTDERGCFARAWCQREFEAQGLVTRLVQINISHNIHRGTLRGMHFQLSPYEEAKVVSCTQGAIFDVVLDLRPNSPTYLAWAAEKLTAENRRALYIPEGCAHGFQTLMADTQVLYLMSEFYAPSHGRGVRYDDQVFGIEWPLEVACIADADRSWPDYQPIDYVAAAGKST